MAFDPNMRASDADRDRVASLLREHHAAGRLTPAEFDERLDRTFSAVTVGDLDRLLADLPSIDLYRLPDAALTRQPRQAQPARPRRSGRSAGWRAAWAAWFCVTVVTFVVWAVAGGGYVWPLWIAAPWGAVLAGCWLTSTALGGGGSSRGVDSGSMGQRQLPRADDDLPGRPGR